MSMKKIALEVSDEFYKELLIDLGGQAIAETLVGKIGACTHLAIVVGGAIKKGEQSLTRNGLLLLAGVARQIEMEEMKITAEQANIFRQWFDSLQDTHPEFLDQEDYKLAAKLYEICDMKLPNSILDYKEGES